jgi:tripartite-type tricarboxylate transporter receptor subunit TctC
MHRIRAPQVVFSLVLLTLAAAASAQPYPAKTLPAIVARLNQAMSQALANPEVVKKLYDADLEIWGGTPEQFAAMIRSETAKWGKLVRDRAIKAD